MQARDPTAKTAIMRDFLAHGICRRQSCGKGRMRIEKSEMTAMMAEAIPRMCLLVQWPGMEGFQSFEMGEHFLLLVLFRFMGFVSGMGNDGTAYFGDEDDGADCVVEDVGTDESLHGAVEGSASMGHEYSNVLQEDGNLDGDYDWTVDG